MLETCVGLAASAVVEDAAELWCHQDASPVEAPPTRAPQVINCRCLRVEPKLPTETCLCCVRVQGVFFSRVEGFVPPAIWSI